MSRGTDIWRLPGPGSYVDDIARSVTGGQHVAAVLPRYLAADPERGDALVVAILDRLPHGQRVQPWPTDGRLVAAVARQVIFEQDPPVTVPELIRHPDVVGMTFVCLVDDLEVPHREEMGAFLRRLEAESRSVPAGERCTFVVITERAWLPQFAGNEPADLTLANCWYWNRVARWDVAAHLAARLPGQAQVGILHEVQTETIIELARWDFDLAARLADTWSGDSVDLASLVGSYELPGHALPPGGRIGTRPPETVMDAWEAGAVDGWHQDVVLSPTCLLQERARLNRHLWAGQARVLLPWIEITRERLEARVRNALAEEGFRQALCDFAVGDFEPTAETVTEIGLLNKVVRARIGKSAPNLRDAAAALHTARNQLAHLRPIPQGRLEALVRVCDFLRT